MSFSTRPLLQTALNNCDVILFNDLCATTERYADNLTNYRSAVGGWVEVGAMRLGGR